MTSTSRNPPDTNAAFPRWSRFFVLLQRRRRAIQPSLAVAAAEGRFNKAPAGGREVL